MEAHHTDAAPAPRAIHTQDPDFDKLHPFFGWLPVDIIKQTFAINTQFARMPMSTIFIKFGVSVNSQSGSPTT
jgi:hypothetical protein